jgi:hypothetical protein
VATMYSDLIAVAEEAIATVAQESVVLALARQLRMPEGVESLPIVAVAPQVGWVSPAIGGRKLVTKIKWSSEQLIPEELAARSRSQTPSLTTPVFRSGTASKASSASTAAPGRWNEHASWDCSRPPRGGAERQHSHDSGKTRGSGRSGSSCSTSAAWAPHPAWRNHANHGTITHPAHCEAARVCPYRQRRRDAADYLARL